MIHGGVTSVWAIPCLEEFCNSQEQAPLLLELLEGGGAATCHDPSDVFHETLMPKWLYHRSWPSWCICSCNMSPLCLDCHILLFSKPGMDQRLQRVRRPQSQTESLSALCESHQAVQTHLEAHETQLWFRAW